MTSFVPTAPERHHTYDKDHRARRWERVLETGRDWAELTAHALQNSNIWRNPGWGGKVFRQHIAELREDLDQVYRPTLAQLRRDMESDDPVKQKAAEIWVHQYEDRIRATERVIHETEAALKDPAAMLALQQKLEPRLREMHDSVSEFVSLKEAALPGGNATGRGEAVCGLFTNEIESVQQPPNLTGAVPAYKQQLDRLYALGQGETLQAENREERICHQLLMPRLFMQAKWRHIITWADALYDINLHDTDPVQIDDANLERLAELYTHMAEHERGATNPVMPEVNKLRHNAATHSLGVARLVDRIFHRARTQLKYMDASLLQAEFGLGMEEAEQALGQLWQWRQKAMAAALVHDGGENKGEKSNGEMQQGASTAENKAFERIRGAIEHQQFTGFIDGAGNRILQRAELLPENRQRQLAGAVADQDWQARREQWTDAFDFFESDKHFLSRFGKAAERLDSQYDYLTMGAAHAEADIENKGFSIGYVLEVIYDIDRDTMKKLREEHGLDRMLDIDFRAFEGPNSLHRLKDHDADGVPHPPATRLLNSLLLSGLEHEYHVIREAQREKYLQQQPNRTFAPAWAPDGNTRKALGLNNNLASYWQQQMEQERSAGADGPSL